MNTTLLYINKRSILINNDEKCENNGESLSIATAKSRINPFTYLSRNDTKLDFSPDLNVNILSSNKHSIYRNNFGFEN